MSKIAVINSLANYCRAQPLFSEGFRVFFPLTALYGVFSIMVWGGALSGVFELPFGQDAFLFHRYEMFFGFLTAAMAGFITTAAPEWSKTPRVAGIELLSLAILWLLGRVAFWLIAIVPLSIVLVLHLSFLLLVLWKMGGRLWQVRMRHLVWPIALLCAAQAYAAYELIWLETFENAMILAEAALSIMVLTALAPVSTVIVNDALSRKDAEITFLARPPLRRFAMLAIVLYISARILGGSEALQGWLAFAAAFAVLGILQDWQLRYALASPFSKALYCVYWFMAAGFAFQGAGYLELVDTITVIAGEHVIFIGSLCLATLMVMIIAGLRHSGRELRLHFALKAAIGCLLLSVICRAILPIWIESYDLIGLSWVLFALSFAFYAVFFIPVVLKENAEN
ncbi:NnrS family protein [Polycladidibacter stylochi]|uniref:NnrS family protein n=1 Tax=Polycladidibacter stylochi TaxID=1807766 RepID=UPI000834F291|nr:NnrS family protein [Pseudovibrio stylochi]